MDTRAIKFVQDPGRVRELAAGIAEKKLSPVDLVRRYLARIAEIDAQVQAWRLVDADRALSVARQRETEAAAGRIRGPLHGVPVAIKDIIDVEGLPTRANSRLRADAPPATGDAGIVLALKAQGAIVLGKAHTTEYAFFDPSPARNPHNIAHTPGGSSSGSAAAVAAGMAPIAVGTQTVASVNRPAAYCGVAAFKPSTGSVSCFGITPLGPSYDTPGFYGWSVDDAVFVYEAVAPQFARRLHEPVSPSTIRVCILEDAHITDAISDMQAALRQTADAIANAGNRVERKPSPIAFERLFQIQRSTMAYEAGRALKNLLDHPAGMVGEKIVGLVHEGLAISGDRYLEERREIGAMRATLFGNVETDVFLWPATPSTAPEGLAWTGDPKYISPWTALGGPIVSLPAGVAANGLPVGCIIAARPGRDAAMCDWARRLAPGLTA